MGVRPGTRLSESHRKAIAAGLRRARQRGWKENSSAWPIGLAAITPEDRQRAAKKAGETMAGRPQNMNTVCGKHAKHKNAKWWKFENKALGAVIEGKNLNQLVRENSWLFDPKDIQWTGSLCRAVQGLRYLKNAKNQTANSWKGWMICTPNA